MAALRPIIREPRSSSERAEAARLAIETAMTKTMPSQHPGALFTTESAGVKIKPSLRGGIYSPVSNSKAGYPA